MLSFKLSLQVCAAEFENQNIIQCLHAQQLCTVFKTLYVQKFLFCLLPHGFFVRVHVRYDTINSHLTQIFMCGTVNVKTMLLDFFIRA